MDLTARWRITVELPEFLLRALDARVEEANAGAAEEKQITIDDLVELQLAEGISLAEVAMLEARMPGSGAAVSRWLTEID